MNDSELEPPDFENLNSNHGVNRSAPGLSQPAKKRRIWVVVLLFLLGEGLPFYYCGNLRLGIKIAIFMILCNAIGISLFVLFPFLGYLIAIILIIVLANLLVLIYAIRYAVNFNRAGKQINSSVWPGIILFFILATLADEIISTSIKISVVEAYSMPSGSMEKTLLVGDYLLADKFVYGARLPIPFVDLHLPSISEPQVNDLVIFKFPGNPEINYIKRCVAISGQSVEIIDKQLFVDGELVPLPAEGRHSDFNLFPHSNTMVWRTSANSRYPEYQGNRDNMPKFVVPEGKLFVLGDNRDNSADSRYWGCLDRKAVLGKAKMIHWSWASYDPCDRPLAFPRPPDISISRPWSILQCLAFNIYHFNDRVRWSRIGIKLS
jgi:signal peptidase I